MHIHRTLKTPYLLPRVATFAVLVALIGCDVGRDSGDPPERPAEPLPAVPLGPASADGASRDAGADYSDRDTSDSASASDRDLSASNRSGEAASNAQYSLVESATAQIMPTSLGNAEGSVTFSAGEEGRGMRVSVELKGLDPGSHGFHVHAIGDCSADDASSAGEHFNPYDTSHGSPEGAERHVGDMGNIEADQDGRVATELTIRHLAFSGPASILHKSVVIHSKRDDLESQPSGAAGDRVGCGVIGIDDKVFAG